MLVETVPHLEARVADGLAAMRSRIAEACADLAGDGVPAALVHQDLVPVNIVVRDGEPVFVLRYLQARDPVLVDRPFFARLDGKATWFSQLEPLGREDRPFLRFHPERARARGHSGIDRSLTR